MEQFDIVIDAIANDAVLLAIDKASKKEGAILLSLSIGIDATRLFCFMSRYPNSNAVDTFRTLFKPWQKKQSEEKPNPVFPLEGIGCWHPVFPARIDDVMSILSSTIRQLEYFLNSTSDNNKLTVIERLSDGNIKIQ